MKYFLNGSEIHELVGIPSLGIPPVSSNRIPLNLGDHIQCEGEEKFVVHKRGIYCHTPHLITKWTLLFAQHIPCLGKEEG